MSLEPLPVQIEEYPQLDMRLLLVDYPGPLGSLPSGPPGEGEFADTALEINDEVRKEVRQLLRTRGFKPTGRSKPASEYLAKTAAESSFPSINLAVDLGNLVSLRSGLPVSVIDLNQTTGQLVIETAPPDARYIFNPSGQTIEVGNLLCLGDDEGPCANAVKDSQRTKTSDSTRRTLSVIWGTKALPERSNWAAKFYGQQLDHHQLQWVGWSN